MIPTRQEMLSAIEHKIAQIVKGEWTGHQDCLNCGEQFIFTTHTCIVRKPVMIGDVLQMIDNKQTWLDGKDKAEWRQEVFGVLMLWKTKREPLSAQDDQCISYIFNLLPPTPNQV